MGDAMDVLAGYLTDAPRVTTHSTQLNSGGVRSDEARAFFALREALGIRGYAGPAEAREAISAAMAKALAH